MAREFDWMGSGTAPNAGAFQDQFVRGIRERARLLANLGFDEATATTRITAAVDWEFDDAFAGTRRPSFRGEIPALVAQVFAHARRGQSRTA